MAHIVHVLIGDGHSVADAAVKTFALFLTATAAFRFTARRPVAEFAPFDWIAAVATGAIVGRAATATDTSWLAATAALVSLLLTHAGLARLRFTPAVQKLIDPPPHVLIRDGRIDRRNLRRCGLTTADLQAALRQHGQCNADNVHLAVFEAKGAISIVPAQALVRMAAGADLNRSAGTRRRPCGTGIHDPYTDPPAMAPTDASQISRQATRAVAGQEDL
jgi:uncharacterized membrane protein YcaP (DUF421 family)